LQIKLQTAESHPKNLAGLQSSVPDVNVRISTHQQFLGKMPRNGHTQVRVARFFLTQYTKTKENIPNYHNITKMAIKYTK
jgi:hypothetical protein